MKRFFVFFALLLLAGCATAPEKIIKPEEISPAAKSAKSARHMIVFVPLTDDDAASWLTLFSRYPRLRMVMAMSPRFKQFEKHPDLKVRFDELLKAGRIELAMQLPNPPLLPQIVDINADDILQMVARAKADYYKTWKTLPQGFVLPYGAITPALVRQLERMGFAWVVAAMGTVDTDPVYRSGPLTLWDGAPAIDRTATLIRVWDERTMPQDKTRKPLEAWAQELEKHTDIQVLLPSDFSVPSGSLPEAATWKRRTWNTPDWSAWLGTPAKDAAWVQLRKAREALEKFKNSGQASVKRLDMAYEEYFQAANASYFAAIGNPGLPAATSEDREREFKATLSSVYKIIGQNPPDNLFGSAPASSSPASSGMSIANGFVLEDPVGDVRGNAGPVFDLRRVSVVSSTRSLDITILLAAEGEPRVDVYIDFNHTTDAGTTTMLPGVGLSAASPDAWEYAVRLSSAQALLFKTQTGGTFEPAGTFPAMMKGAELSVSLPRDLLRGNPARWGYQVLSLSTGVADLLDPPGMTQAAFFETVEAGIRGDIPFIRR